MDATKYGSASSLSNNRHIQKIHKGRFCARKMGASHSESLAKISPPTVLEKDIRPIKLICLIAKQTGTDYGIRRSTAQRPDLLQFGNKGVFTTDVIVKLLNIWHKSLHKVTPFEYFFWITPFDRVNHNILLKNLHPMTFSQIFLKCLPPSLHNTRSLFA